MRQLASFVASGVALALPPRCPGCGAVVLADHHFCPTCWGSLRFLGPPWCATCHTPFGHERGADARCAACLDSPPIHAGVRAAVAYGEVAKRVALRLKYNGRTAFAETVARQMARWLPEDADLLVPVPLHRWRLWGRGYNQAALIAAALSRRSRVPNDPMLLARPRRTPPLREMNPRQRRAAVAGAFAIGDRGSERIVGRHLVLVDDVHTSGATVEGCTRVLRSGGARRVTVLCWARVLDREED